MKVDVKRKRSYKYGTKFPRKRRTGLLPTGWRLAQETYLSVTTFASARKTLQVCERNDNLTCRHREQRAKVKYNISTE